MSEDDVRQGFDTALIIITAMFRDSRMQKQDCMDNVDLLMLEMDDMAPLSPYQEGYRIVLEAVQGCREFSKEELIEGLSQAARFVLNERGF